MRLDIKSNFNDNGNEEIGGRDESEPRSLKLKDSIVIETMRRNHSAVVRKCRNLEWSDEAHFETSVSQTEQR